MRSTRPPRTPSASAARLTSLPRGARGDAISTEAFLAKHAGLAATLRPLLPLVEVLGAPRGRPISTASWLSFCQRSGSKTTVRAGAWVLTAWMD